MTEFTIKMVLGMAITLIGVWFNGPSPSAMQKMVSGGILALFSAYGAGSFIYWLGSLV